jgi:hypothetical protein
MAGDRRQRAAAPWPCSTVRAMWRRLWWLSSTDFFILRGRREVGTHLGRLAGSGEHRNKACNGGQFPSSFGGGVSSWW